MDRLYFIPPSPPVSPVSFFTIEKCEKGGGAIYGVGRVRGAGEEKLGRQSGRVGAEPGDGERFLVYDIYYNFLRWSSSQPLPTLEGRGTAPWRPPERHAALRRHVVAPGALELALRPLPEPQAPATRLRKVLIPVYEVHVVKALR